MVLVNQQESRREREYTKNQQQIHNYLRSYNKGSELKGTDKSRYYESGRFQHPTLINTQNPDIKLTKIP
jgi:hypothetical protein